MTISIFASLLVSAAGIIMVLKRSATASQADFVLSSALAASTGLQSLLEQLTRLEVSMVAVERLKESKLQAHYSVCASHCRVRSMQSTIREVSKTSLCSPDGVAE